MVVSWTWGYGWLYQLGYVDFAGSSVVHLAGAMSAFAVSICVGPRNGRYDSPSKELVPVSSNDELEVPNVAEKDIEKDNEQ